MNQCLEVAYLPAISVDKVHVLPPGRDKYPVRRALNDLPGKVTGRAKGQVDFFPLFPGKKSHLSR